MTEGAENPPKSKWYHDVWAVLVGLVMLGPLAFPVLWKSPHFTLKWKWLLTLFFTVLTVILILLTWWTVVFALDLLKKAELI